MLKIFAQICTMKLLSMENGLAILRFRYKNTSLNFAEHALYIFCLNFFFSVKKVYQLQLSCHLLYLTLNPYTIKPRKILFSYLPKKYSCVFCFVYKIYRIICLLYTYQGNFQSFLFRV